MKALRIYAGPKARHHMAQHGLLPEHVGIVPAAAGGPKGLILGPLDRHIFGEWLAGSQQTVHLVGASIGAWRMATACLNDPQAAFARLEHDYIHQDYSVPPGSKGLTPAQISASFGANLQTFYGGRVPEVLHQPRFRLHVVTSRGRHLLGREGRARTPIGYLGAFLTNSVQRRAMGAWLERVVFSSPATAGDAPASLPFLTQDYRSRQVALTEANFNQALQASCSIPFVLQAVHDIPGAPPGAYWDGGITDYHLHLNYRYPQATEQTDTPPLVLYPHFQQAVVPGWLDKGLRWRHGATAFLDNTVLLAPNPEWVKSLPNGKLPDRNDFTHYQNNTAERIRVWTAAVSASQQMADEWQSWLLRPDLTQVHAL